MDFSLSFLSPHDWNSSSRLSPQGVSTLHYCDYFVWKFCFLDTCAGLLREIIHGQMQILWLNCRHFTKKSSIYELIQRKWKRGLGVVYKKMRHLSLVTKIFIQNIFCTQLQTTHSLHIMLDVISERLLKLLFVKKFKGVHIPLDSFGPSPLPLATSPTNCLKNQWIVPPSLKTTIVVFSCIVIIISICKSSSQFSSKFRNTAG